MSQYYDPFKSRIHDLSGPARGSDLVVPDDNQNLPKVALSLRVDSGGTVVFRDLYGNESTWVCSAGEIIPVAVTRVMATGTDAATIYALVS